MNDDNAVITNNYPVYHPVVSAHGKAHVILETGLSNSPIPVCQVSCQRFCIIKINLSEY